MFAVVGVRLAIKIPPFTGYALLVVFLNAMQFCDCRTIFNELIPIDPACPQYGEYGCLCARNVDCNQTKFLECIDGKCQCEFSLHRTFDESQQKCMSLVGSHCSSNGDGWSPECIKNAECEGGRCQCRGGYSRTSANTCSINFGEECGPRQCNIDRGLACKEGRCQCMDSAYVYSALHTMCIDPEAVVRQFFQQLVQRIVQRIVNFKLRRAMDVVTLPFRVVRRLALGPLAGLVG